MEWRIILPVLCLIGFLHVPGNAADTNNATISPNNSITYEFNIVFYANLTFSDTYSNMTNSDTIALKNSIISQVTSLFASFKNFQRFDILQFRNGSIVVDGKLYFNSSDSKPSTDNLTQILNSGNFNFTVLTNLTKITEATTAAAPAITTNGTTATATVPTTAKLAIINVVFKLNQTFKDVYASLSDPETKQLAENITNAFTPSYRRSFSNFVRMWIRKFSPGSTVADSIFEFDTTNSTGPNVTGVKNVFINAVANGNFSFTVDTASISVTDITNSGTNVTENATATTQATTTLASIAAFNLTFKMTGNFTNDLLNLSSAAATTLSNTIVGQLDGVFKIFTSYRRTFIRWYRNGSIAVGAGIECNRASSPTATDLAKALANAVRNGAVTLPIDTTTILVTDSTGFTASKSPVLASMLTAFWMTLASLLLSAVMH